MFLKVPLSIINLLDLNFSFIGANSGLIDPRYIFLIYFLNLVWNNSCILFFGFAIAHI